MSYGALEAAMEQMYDLGDVSVTVTTDDETFTTDYNITFETRRNPSFCSRNNSAQIPATPWSRAMLQAAHHPHPP